MFEGLTSILSVGASRLGRPAPDDADGPEPAGSGARLVDAEAVGDRVDAAIERVVDDPDERDALTAAVRAELAALDGVDEDDGRAVTVDATGEALSLSDLVEGFPNPVYVVDDERRVLAYNTASKRQLGLDDDHDAFLGGDVRETIAEAVYADGSRKYTLPDKVVQNPHDAHEAWDVTDATDDYPLCGERVYADTSVSTNADGEETHIYFTAVPLFSDDGDLEMVVEVIHDRSEEVRRQAAVEGLVAEVTDTLAAIGSGDLAARAEFTDGHGVLDPELLALTDAVNAMAAEFEGLVQRVDEKAERLARSIERATESAHRIDEQVADQTESFEVVATEMDDFSATMEEVAASAKEVADAAEEALAEADRGVDAGEDAREATDEVLRRSEALVETVEELDDYMAEIGEVAEVISDVAEQTNLLALNANIEAARAGESGRGFAVVADEVKNLAEKTQRQTGEIAARIEEIQEQAGQTVEEVEASHERVESVDEEIGAAMASLQTISRKVDLVASGIQDVADANDQQAVAVEEVTATAEEARKSAEAVSGALDDIVGEAESQERAVSELADSVQELSSGGAGDPDGPALD